MPLRYNGSPVILVIDNYDSFTYNIVQYLGQCGAEVQVVRNDKAGLADILAMRPRGIVLSPGPGTPADSGVCQIVTGECLKKDGRLKGVPLFGVCLGHQTMGAVGGGRVGRAKNVMHGKASMVTHDGKGLFKGVPSPFKAIRYHSLVIEMDTVPSGFLVTATSQDDNEIMGVRHKELPIEGLQFHPESVLTEHGLRIVQNFLDQT